MLQDQTSVLWQHTVLKSQRSVTIVDICLVSTADICPVSAADICSVSTADICPVSTEDIYPVSTEDISYVSRADMCPVQRTDIKSWPAEAAIAADYYWSRGGVSKKVHHRRRGVYP